MVLIGLSDLPISAIGAKKKLEKRKIEKTLYNTLKQNKNHVRIFSEKNHPILFVITIIFCIKAIT